MWYPGDTKRVQQGARWDSDPSHFGLIVGGLGLGPPASVAQRPCRDASGEIEVENENWKGEGRLPLLGPSA